METNHSEDYAALVEPRLGSTCPRWIATSTACLPQGMVSLAPDTKIDVDWGCGYLWKPASALGFSHVHDWQVGAIRVMPMSGPVVLGATPQEQSSGFSHETEVCKPGDHRLHLDRFGIQVELTASTRVGLHRWTFHEGDSASFVFDLASTLGPSEMEDAMLRRTGMDRYEGYVVNRPTFRRPKPLQVFFAITLSCPATIKVAGQESALVDEISGEGVVAVFELGKVAAPVELRVALSYTSTVGAWRNLDAEVTGHSFDAIRDQARATWNRELSVIHVEGGTEEQRARFYTDLFHALAGRRTCSDVDGHYVDNTGETPVIRRVALDPQTGLPAYRHFNSDAFWGVQWSLAPLWSLAYPGLMREYCECFMDMYRNGGLIPRGPSGGNYTFVMTSAQTTPFFVTALLQGIYQPEDTEEVFQALLKNHGPGGLMSKCGYEHESEIGGGITDYIERGYIPEDIRSPEKGFHDNGGAQTVEHSFNDWCLAQLARHFGKFDVAVEFEERSKNWRNLYDPNIGTLRPRLSDGGWMSPYDPVQYTKWTEGSAETYLFYGGHDLEGLIKCLGGRRAAIDRLESDFARSDKMGMLAEHGKHHEIPMDFGNEPALATPFLFAALGAQSHTDHWVRRILEVKGGNAPTDSYGGDEDQGIMGAWNAMAAIGLSSHDAVCGETPKFRLHAPLFEFIKIRRPDGHGGVSTISITAECADLAEGAGATLTKCRVNSQEHPLYLSAAELRQDISLTLQLESRDHRSSPPACLVSL